MTKANQRLDRWAAFLAAAPDGEPCEPSKRSWEIWMGREGVTYDGNSTLLWWSGDPYSSQGGGVSEQSTADFMAQGPSHFTDQRGSFSDRTARVLRELIYVIRRTQEDL